MDEFIQLCREAGIDTSKTLVQIKEKWRGVFDKYKNVCDNNNRTVGISIISCCCSANTWKA